MKSETGKSDILNTFPVLETERLILSQITLECVEDIFELFSSDKVTEFYDCYSFKSKDEAIKTINMFEERFEKKTGIRWGITLKGNHKIIGTIGFNRFVTERSGDLGYDLNENYWGKGIVTEAIKAVTDFGFDILRIHRIEAGVIPGNRASQIVLEKNDFTKEGILRDKGFWKEKHQTVLSYSKLSSDRK